MNDTKTSEKIRIKIENHLDNPNSILRNVKTVLLGFEKPDSYTRSTFYVNLVFILIFILWFATGYIVVKNASWIGAQKKVDVDYLLELRAKALDLNLIEFKQTLLIFFKWSVLLWFLLLCSNILLYRRKFYFIYFFAAGFIGFFIVLFSLLGNPFWKEDVSTFDKTVLFILGAHTAFFAYYLWQETNGGFKGFFFARESK